MSIALPEPILLHAGTASRDVVTSPTARYFASMDYGPAPESETQARAWIAKHNGRFGHFIGGQFSRPRRLALLSRNPATGEKLASFANGGKNDVAAAVAAARTAQPGWAAKSGAQRGRYLYALARAIQRNQRLFAVLETLDNGKPIREARDDDVPLAARHFHHHAGWAMIQREVFPDYLPIGVCAQIVPWNFPLLMLAWKIAPALALGNTVVLKPAEQTPLSALLFAELAQGTGLPAGVVNIVTGTGTTGAELVRAKGVDKIAFTGSTEVGREIRRVTAGSGKQLSLELGGKSPFIVFEDADLDAAVEGVVDSVWYNQGEVCCAGSRLLVQEGVADEFHRRLKRRLTVMRVGDPLSKHTDVGAIISKAQLARIKALVATGLADGGIMFQAKLGRMPVQGCFFPPTLLENVPHTSLAAREEIFGPVLVSATFRTPSEAVTLANNSRYGLAACVYSETIGLALDIAPRLDAGVVWINASNLFDACVGFGGYKESGFGREGGLEGAWAYLQPRAWTQRPSRAAAPARRRQMSSLKPAAAAAIVDRTAKLFIGGRQVRPDGGYAHQVLDPDGGVLAEVALGNRKDVRNAVEAARKGANWARMSGYQRAQVLYFCAENLAARSAEFGARLTAMTGCRASVAANEVRASIDRLFAWAAWADKLDGRVHEPPLDGVTLAVREPLGVVGLGCPPEAPLLALISLAGALLAAGNRVVAVPSFACPLVATDLYQVIETSDFPAGTFNIVTGKHAELVPVLAEHLDVDGLWVFGSKSESACAERASAGNLKRTLVDYGRKIDWFDHRQAEGEILLRHALQTKNIWIPYGA